MDGEPDVDLANQLGRGEVPIDEHPVEPRRPAVARDHGRRRGVGRRRRHHDGRDVPLVPLQLRHQHAGGGAEDGDDAAGADEEEAAVRGEGRRRGDVALATGDHGASAGFS